MSIGGLLAVLVLVACLVIYLIGGSDPKVLGLIAATDLAILFAGWPLRLGPPA